MTCEADNCGGDWHYEERDGIMRATEPCPVNNPNHKAPADRTKRRRAQEQRRRGGTPKPKPKDDSQEQIKRWWT